MSNGVWIPGTDHVDLTNHGYGPFQDFRGVVLHVNDTDGNTPVDFYRKSNDVTPNFQVDLDGTIHQMLPLSWQPWCQRDGNQQYAAIETGGRPANPLTPAQYDSVKLIVKYYHDVLGMPLVAVNRPGDRGFGWHGMGGEAWGGHYGCPGDRRKIQRTAICSDLTQGDDDVPSAEDIAVAVWSHKNAMSGKNDPAALSLVNGNIHAAETQILVRSLAADVAAIKHKLGIA